MKSTLRIAFVIAAALLAVSAFAATRSTTIWRIPTSSARPREAVSISITSPSIPGRGASTCRTEPKSWW